MGLCIHMLGHNCLILLLDTKVYGLMQHPSMRWISSQKVGGFLLSKRDKVISGIAFLHVRKIDSMGICHPKSLWLDSIDGV